MTRLTAHCLVKNEENFIFYAITSVVDFVDQIIVFDTGSTDQTVSIIKKLVDKYSGKIIFEEKGLCDKAQHTRLRQEMIDRTKTDWFMILDGDEVWTRRGMGEVSKILPSNPKIECIIAPFYLCVGDVYHRHYKKGNIEMLGKKDFFYPRFFKKTTGIHWRGDYDQDAIFNENNEIIFNQNNTYFLQNKFWHATHLVRSSIDTDFSSGGVRADKIIRTYFLIGVRIQEPVPEVFGNLQISNYKSFIYFWLWIVKKIFKKIQ